MVSLWPSLTFLIRFLECSLPVVKCTPCKCRERVINPDGRVCLDTAASVRIETSPSPDGSDPRGRGSRGGGWEAAPGFSAHLLSFWGRLRSCLLRGVVFGSSLWPVAQLVLVLVFSHFPGGWGWPSPGAGVPPRPGAGAPATEGSTLRLLQAHRSPVALQLPWSSFA